MIRNWYSQIAYPALKTKREITKYINWQQFTKGTRGKPNEQLFPRQVVIQLDVPKYVTHIIGEPKYKYGQQEQVTVRNHNRSTALKAARKMQNISYYSRYNLADLQHSVDILLCFGHSSFWFNYKWISDIHYCKNVISTTSYLHCRFLFETSNLKIDVESLNSRGDPDVT